MQVHESPPPSFHSRMCTSTADPRTIEKDRTSRDQSVGVATIGASLQNFNMEEIGELLFKKILPCHGSPDRETARQNQRKYSALCALVIVSRIFALVWPQL